MGVQFKGVDSQDFANLKSNECDCPEGYPWIERTLKSQFSHSVRYQRVWNKKWNNFPEESPIKKQVLVVMALSVITLVADRTVHTTRFLSLG